MAMAVSNARGRVDVTTRSKGPKLSPTERANVTPCCERWSPGFVRIECLRISIVLIQSTTGGSRKTLLLSPHPQVKHYRSLCARFLHRRDRNQSRGSQLCLPSICHSWRSSTYRLGP